jgi:hypothetical protein
MQSWDLKAIEAEPHQPQILASGEDARTIVLRLPAGEELPGDGHPRAMTLEQKADVRERAARHPQD